MRRIQLGFGIYLSFLFFAQRVCHDRVREDVGCRNLD